MSPKMSAVLDPATGHGAAEKARKEAHGKAATAAMEVEKDAVTPCPLDVQQLCRNKKQDEFEKNITSRQAVVTIDDAMKIFWRAILS